MSENITLNSIIQTYNVVVGKIEQKALNSKNRVYGGIIRAGKGELVENIGKLLVKIAWEELGNKGILEFKDKTIKIPLKKDYIKKIKSEEVRNYIKKNFNKFFYRIKPDIQVFINGKLKISIECKAYTENAMLKRILVDATLIKQVFPNISFVLLQLESQLGGDYSQFTTGKLGSYQTHTLFSYFDVELNIITLLRGERKVNQPIHKPKFFKPLTIESLKRSCVLF